MFWVRWGTGRSIEEQERGVVGVNKGRVCENKVSFER